MTDSGDRAIFLTRSSRWSCKNQPWN